ncbi:MAG: hypothetical protein MJ151_00700 [Lachnospiraceae bacterium]|nr:hypothetical protein [Lachnospiraceae bacterium]
MQRFRPEAIKKLTTPEELTDYIKVSTPSTWIIAIGVFIFLIGVSVWLFFGVINTSIKTTVVAKEGVVQIIVNDKNVKRVEEQMKVKVNDRYLKVERVCSYEDAVTGYRLYLEGDIADGVYPAEIILESVRPIDFFAK